MPAGATQDEARRIAREAFNVFEHKEGSKMVDEKYDYNKSAASWSAKDHTPVVCLQGYPHHCQVYGDQSNGPAN